jgi:hypothetical protein
MRLIGLAVVLTLGLTLAPLASEAQQAERPEGRLDRMPGLAAELVRAEEAP